MDKFVVKKKRDLQVNQQTGSKKKHLSQSTLQALSGVVVIEELESFKRILESDSEPIEEKIRILNKLHQKNPSKEVLIKVGIGKTVNILRRGFEESEGEERNLKKLSLKVYKKWKNELERKVELKSNPIDVQCDKETERLRDSATKFLSSALGDCGRGSDSASSNSADSQTHHTLSEKLEFEIFRQSSRLVNSKYRKLSRKVIFGLKSDSRKDQLLGQKLSVGEFVALFNVQ